MPIIPQCIITNHIFCRLPAKSVGRFRCVSKEWLSLLTEPQFIQTHQKTLNTNHFLFESNDGSLYSVPYNNHELVSLTKLPFKLHNFRIDGSANGLVLATGYKNLNGKGWTVLALNLTTKDYVELPIASRKDFFGFKGFGYDSVSDDYKVVVFSRFEHYNGDVYVYSLRTNTVKQVMSRSPYFDDRFCWPAGVFVNGFLHWILGIDCKPVIVAFSLADDKLSELPPPNEVDLSDFDTKLVALGEKLAIFNEVKGDIWLMNEYGLQKSWTKIVVDGFNEIPMYKPIVFYDNGKVLFLRRREGWNAKGNIVLNSPDPTVPGIYDVEEQTFSKTSHISYMKMRYYIGAYAESLVSPKFSTSI
ncbi:F-box associated interaction domain-containing protein [Artemisia annua]|uniref:F-box associated interaction domain-containing protein n=1 Tax=Artemisia annua TaxID=35608 RepID=A0A2U1MI84_ARTAN|nr:F-box associated interaction domain-containing protein [Artemisia annua]